MDSLLHRHKYVAVIIPIMIIFFMSCSYSSKKVDYPAEFKYASLSTEYSGIADSIQPIVADSIRASIARTGLIFSPIDSLKGDSLLIVKVNVVKKGAAVGISAEFYPQGGNIWSEIYYSGVGKNDPIITITAQSIVPFSDDYNLFKALEILNNGLITKGGTANIFRKD